MHRFFINKDGESKYVVYYSLDFKNNSVIFSLHHNLKGCNPPCPTWFDKLVVPIDDVDKAQHDYDIENLIMYYLFEKPETRKSIWGKRYDQSTDHWTNFFDTSDEEQ